LINSINRDDARRVRDAATSLQTKSGKTVGAHTAQQYWYAFSAVMTFAENEGFINRTPAKGLRIKGDGILAKDRHKAFSADDLRTIFGAPLFQGCVDDGRNWEKPGNLKPKGTRFWVITLALYTGARGNEILQLTEDDIECAGGTNVLQIRKQTKTAASRRAVPIHSELIRLGFLDYVAEIPKLHPPKTRIFPDTIASKAGYYSDRFGAWFARFLDGIGITDARKSFHSFRHSFEDAAKEAAIPQARINALLVPTFADA
jgi:integrase